MASLGPGAYIGPEVPKPMSRMDYKPNNTFVTKVAL